MVNGCFSLLEFHYTASVLVLTRFVISHCMFVVVTRNFGVASRRARLNPTVAGIFEKLIYDQMYAHFLNNDFLSNEQFGFRSLHSTASVLGKVTDPWLMNLDSGRMSLWFFLIYKKHLILLTVRYF